MADTLLPGRGVRGVAGRAGYSQLPEGGRATQGKANLREQLITWIKTLCKRQIRGLQNAKKKPQPCNTKADEKPTRKEGNLAKKSEGKQLEEATGVKSVSTEPPNPGTGSLPSVERAESLWARRCKTPLPRLGKESPLVLQSTPKSTRPGIREQEVRQLTMESRPGVRDSVVSVPRYDSTMTVPESPVLKCPEPGQTWPCSAWSQESAFPDSHNLDPRSPAPDPRPPAPDPRPPAPDHGLSAMTRLTAVMVFFLGKELVAATRTSRRSRSFRTKSFAAWTQSVAIASFLGVDTKGLGRTPCPHGTVWSASPRDALDCLLVGRQLETVARMLTLLHKSPQSLAVPNTNAHVQGQKRTFSMDPWYLERFSQYRSSFGSFTMGLVMGLVFSACFQGTLRQLLSIAISRCRSVVKR